MPVWLSGSDWSPPDNGHITEEKRLKGANAMKDQSQQNQRLKAKLKDAKTPEEVSKERHYPAQYCADDSTPEARAAQFASFAASACCVILSALASAAGICSF